jgi:hypothetical protein
MRYLLATLLVCALGAPIAEAKSASGAKSASTSKPAKSKKSGGAADLGGIHPLVGSGGY